MKNQILIIGGTGNIGTPLVDLLNASDHTFTVMVRSDDNQAKMAAQGIATVRAELGDWPSVETALENIDTVFLLSAPSPIMSDLHKGLIDRAVAQDTSGTTQPNIVVIWGDDIGVHNISAYNHGIMGYQTPNIDRIAAEGALFTDAYGQQSCTAGRAAFILGQHPFRTGLLTIGMPGSDHGIPDWAPTIADMLKEQGYATGQYGKNHLGDRDEHLPTNHGFDEFFGNLYHLNAEEEPEGYYYPKDPAFRERYGPRGVLRASADGQIEDTGPLTRQRMETIDDEIIAGAGNTQFKPAEFLPDGVYRWRVASLKAGDEFLTGFSDPVTFEVDTTAPGAPLLIEPGEDDLVLVAAGQHHAL